MERGAGVGTESMDGPGLLSMASDPVIETAVESVQETYLEAALFLAGYMFEMEQDQS